VAYVEDSVIKKQQVETEVILAAMVEPVSQEAETELRTTVRDALAKNKMTGKEFDRMKGQLPGSHVQKKYDAIQRTGFDNNPLTLVGA
jgi:hypothetical protein